ncbi:MAG TPA: prepilin-type N-terminal cleavage/methylation domain-containing protein [Phycisphaerae bacterium]|nr:prepilin-type N-terminal cleavage/methylation domain-containing protein [Phycisphaerae bacterium]
MDRQNRGFSIVELLIVITMLAIIAAIAVPRLIDASEDARSSALGTDLQMLRRQVVLYKMQHNGRGPHLDESGALDKPNLPTRLTGRTTQQGKLDDNGAYGPYMKQWPVNPYADGAVAGSITFGTQTAPPRDGATGWYYNTTTCVFSANTTEGGEELDPSN